MSLTSSANFFSWQELQLKKTLSSDCDHSYLTTTRRRIRRTELIGHRWVPGHEWSQVLGNEQHLEQNPEYKM